MRHFILITTRTLIAFALLGVQRASQAQAACTCENGVVATGTACASDGGESCASCNQDYKLKCDDLFISEYLEGAGNRERYFEIYNPTSDTISLDDYAYPYVYNTPTTPGEHENFYKFASGAQIAPGDVYVICYHNANVISDHCDETNYLSNGDDGFCLAKGTESAYDKIDCVGNFKGDPGSGWDVAGTTEATMDHTLVRKANKCANSNWAASSGTTVANSEWIVLGPESEHWGVGSHTISNVCVPVCSGDTPVRQNNVCVAECSGDTPVSQNNVCVAECSGGTPVSQNNVCVAECSGDKPFSQDNVCVAKCSGDKPFSQDNVCVTECAEYVKNPELKCMTGLDISTVMDPSLLIQALASRQADC